MKHTHLEDVPLPLTLPRLSVLTVTYVKRANAAVLWPTFIVSQLCCPSSRDSRRGTRGGKCCFGLCRLLLPPPSSLKISQTCLLVALWLSGSSSHQTSRLILGRPSFDSYTVNKSWSPKHSFASVPYVIWSHRVTHFGNFSSCACF